MWWLLLIFLTFAGGFWLGGATVMLLGYIFVFPGVIFSTIYSAISDKRDAEGMGIVFSVLFWAALAAVLYFRYWRG